MTSPKETREESDNLHAQYRRNFGGLPRITRDAQMLREIRSRTIALREGTSKKHAKLRETLRARAALYTKELKAVEQEQSAGPFAMAAARVASDANAVFERYRRHFGGKERWSRDLGLLEELIEELVLAENNFRLIVDNWDDPSARRNMELVHKNVDVYTSEMREITHSREGLDQEQTVSSTAGWANNLFQTYRNQFAGLPRLSRRPELLARLVNTLRSVEGRMATALAIGNTGENLQGNLRLVQQELQRWEGELAEVLAQRADATLSDLVMALGTEIDAVWEVWGQEYANQSRQTRDLDRLGGLIDRADEVVRQARELHREHEVQATDRLLRVARDQRTILSREYELVGEAISKRTVH